MPSVLIVDDEPNIRRMVGALLSAEGYDVRDAADGATGLALAEVVEPDVALIDLMMPGSLDGLALLARLREKRPDLPVVMMSGRAALADAVRATKLGAFTFLEKPLTPEGTLLALASAFELRQARRAAQALREDLGISGEMIGDSPVMRDVRALVARVGPTDARVLIMGESGTGKELVAAGLHLASPRRDRPFVRVNCAAIPRDLVESEMFGHERGAFTGATERRIGRFELAHTGTLFLDEVGDLHEAAQAKLLRVLQDGELQRVGGEVPIRVAVRVISATNRPLEALAASGAFRADLYYRLSVVPIRVPALRERREDLGALVAHFLAEFCARNNVRRLEIDPAVVPVLAAYAWPGNIRELKNVVERMAILSRGERLTADAIPVEVREPAATRSTTGLQEVRDHAERERIRQALVATDWNVSQAARMLGTERTSLHKRLRALGLKRS